MFTPYPIELWKAKHIYSNYLAKYLQAKIGREKEFEAALQRLRGKNVNTSEEADDIKVTQ